MPALLFNIGQCHRQLGHFERAAFFYGRYLDLAPKAPNAALTQELLQEVGAFRADKKPPVPEPPLHRRWWFWAGAGAVALAVWSPLTRLVAWLWARLRARDRAGLLPPVLEARRAVVVAVEAAAGA